MKARDLLPIIERVRRGTSSGDIVTICDALSRRVVREMADAATPADSEPNNAPPPAAAPPEGFQTRRGKAGIAFAAAVERASKPKEPKKPKKPFGRSSFKARKAAEKAAQ